MVSLDMIPRNDACDREQYGRDELGYLCVDRPGSQ